MWKRNLYRTGSYPTVYLTTFSPTMARSSFLSYYFRKSFPRLKAIDDTAYHPQNNGQTERYNKTVVARLRHCVAEEQSDWEEYIHPLTYAYNQQVNRSTGTTPFSFAVSRHPPEPPTFDIPTAMLFYITG